MLHFLQRAKSTCRRRRQPTWADEIKTKTALQNKTNRQQNQYRAHVRESDRLGRWHLHDMEALLPTLWWHCYAEPRAHLPILPCFSSSSSPGSPDK